MTLTTFFMNDPLSLENTRRLVEGCVEEYRDSRLKGADGYISTEDMLAGRQQEIYAERDRKLETTRKQRPIRRQQAACSGFATI